MEMEWLIVKHALRFAGHIGTIRPVFDIFMRMRGVVKEVNAVIDHLEGSRGRIDIGPVVCNMEILK